MIGEVECSGCGVYYALNIVSLPTMPIPLCDNCAVILRQESKRVTREITERNTKRNQTKRPEAREERG